MKKGAKRAVRELRDEIAAVGALVLDCSRRLRRIERLALIGSAPPHMHAPGGPCPICAEAQLLLREIAGEGASS